MKAFLIAFHTRKIVHLEKLEKKDFASVLNLE